MQNIYINYKETVSSISDKALYAQKLLWYVNFTEFAVIKATVKI